MKNSEIYFYSNVNTLFDFEVQEDFRKVCKCFYEVLRGNRIDETCLLRYTLAKDV